MAAPIISCAIQEYIFPTGVSSLLVSDSSLFIGLATGCIIEWKYPGEEENILHQHKSSVLSLLHCGESLWSSSKDKTIRLWNLQYRQCIKTVDIDGTLSTWALWKGFVIGGGSLKTL